MKINIAHVALYVKDLERSRAYYTTYFEGQSNNLYENKEGFSSYFITFSDNVRLELMHHKDLVTRSATDKICGYHHIALSVGDEEKVRILTDKISADGYELYSPPRYTGDGYFESCVADPDGNRIEITV